ncbi:hypothetical protein LBMAG42_29740 [Deltaproteobacteria bacterium]|nr:hypothetical protein LBMAG42_29740 [Deltaproteobacteria bacterium]
MPAETPVTFSTLLVSLASTALAHLGQAEGVDVPVDKRLAHHTLEVLDLLAVKTAGNLDDDEARLLQALQAELRGALAR